MEHLKTLSTKDVLTLAGLIITLFFSCSTFFLTLFHNKRSYHIQVISKERVESLTKLKSNVAFLISNLNIYILTKKNDNEELNKIIESILCISFQLNSTNINEKYILKDLIIMHDLIKTIININLNNKFPIQYRSETLTYFEKNTIKKIEEQKILIFVQKLTNDIEKKLTMHIKEEWQKVKKEIK